MKNRHEGLAEMKKDGVTYCNMFWLFMFGNVLGVLLEGTWCAGETAARGLPRQRRSVSMSTASMTTR